MNTEILVSSKEDPNRREMRGYRARRRFGDPQNPRKTRALDDGRLVGDGASVQIAIHREEGGIRKGARLSCGGNYHVDDAAPVPLTQKCLSLVHQRLSTVSPICRAQRPV